MLPVTPRGIAAELSRLPGVRWVVYIEPAPPVNPCPRLAPCDARPAAVRRRRSNAISEKHLPHHTRVRPAARPPRTASVRCLTRTAHRAGALILLLVVAGACRAAGPAFGPTPAEARANAEGFFGAFAARFTNVQRVPRFEAARAKLSRHALNPSRIYEDDAVWTTRSGATRTLAVAGRPLSNRYILEDRAAIGPLIQPGQSRHGMSLTRVQEGVYRWDTMVDMAAGRVAPDELHAVWRAIVRTAEGRSEAALRADYRMGLPRTTQTLGKLFTLDTIQSVAQRDGSSIVRLRATMHASRLRTEYPNFAKYLEKYFGPARYDLALGDGAGARWLEATLRDDVYSFRLRTRDGQLVALDGSGRTMPRQLVFEGNLHAKVSIFGISVKQLRGDVTLLDSPGERGWLLRFRQEPDWDFPLAADRMIKSSLRRPFAGEGTTMRISAVGDGRSQTLIARRISTTVEESTIVRWIGNLSSTAMSDFAGKVEAEENRFLSELFRSLGDDLTAGLR